MTKAQNAVYIDAMAAWRAAVQRQLEQAESVEDWTVVLQLDAMVDELLHPSFKNGRCVVCGSVA